MTYLIILDGPEDPIRLKTRAEVCIWLKENKYATEPSAEQYGIDSMLREWGSIQIFKLSNETEQADGTIEWREEI